MSTEEMGNKLGKKRIVYMAIPYVIFLLTCFSAELILRIVMPDLRYFYHAKGITGSIRVELNSLGMREKELSMTKRGNEYRIMCIGDSTTFGQGERFEDTWPKQLESKLKSIDNNISVINAGGLGGHPHSHLKIYMERLKNIEIDMCILGFCMSNDVIVNTNLLDQEQYMLEIQRSWWSNFKDTTRRLRSVLSRVYIFAFIQYIAKKLQTIFENPKLSISNYPQFFHAYGVTREYRQAWSDTFNTLKSLNNILKEKQIIFVIVPIPSRGMISEDPRDRRFMIKSFKINPIEKLRMFCKEQKILFIESLASLQTARKEMLDGRISYDPMYIDVTNDPTHPNAYGYKIIADSVYKRIAPILEN